ncbi:DUF3842 family protein [Heliobacterium gestii]|uniref:DUF3842 family protein n=1 Tax=Heliomicrobium gestii TaxID=2699 RepID=A0A845LNF6_HELGE|nr:DUF3842 family protein [Heliomicrobium gestii]MBM7868053.1 Ni,Fe-hydrogenase maturation factor [Heliomicrobium gestii]MZP44416.1 DUF3842 family protein [Heliomicrobium gestii]
MRIAVIDGQGGGIGRHIVERIRQELPDDIDILALGTNAMATAAMLKAGANDGATGENAMVQNLPEVDIIAGSVAIVMAHSMLGELTPAMAEAVGRAKAKKIMIPLNRSRIEIAGAKSEPLPHQVQALVRRIKELVEEERHV